MRSSRLVFTAVILSACILLIAAFYGYWRKHNISEAVYVAPASSVAVLSQEKSQPADAFIDSIGVNTGSGDRYDAITGGFISNYLVKDLKELGIRHVRVTMPSCSNHPNIANIQTLWQNGIGTMLTAKLTHEANSTGDPYTVEPSMAKNIVKTLGPAVDAVEDPNEYDLHNNDASALPALYFYSKSLHDELKGDPTTFSVPIIGPALTAHTSSGGQDFSLPIGDYSGIIDAANLHTYDYPFDSSTNTSPNSDSQRFLGANTKFAQLRAMVSRDFPNEPALISEYGLSNCDTSLPASNSGVRCYTGVNNATYAQYLPRQLFRYFNLGYTRTYIYQFIDSVQTSQAVPNPSNPPSGKMADPHDQEQNFGLLDYDGNPKPVYNVLKNITDILKDTGGNFTPDSLGLTIDSPSNPIQHTLLEKSNGDFYLVLWNQVDNSTNPPAATVSLNFDRTMQAVDIFHPEISDQAVSTQTGLTSLTMEVTGEPSILRLQPINPTLPANIPVSAVRPIASPIPVDPSFQIHMTSTTSGSLASMTADIKVIDTATGNVVASWNRQSVGPDGTVSIDLSDPTVYAALKKLDPHTISGTSTQYPLSTLTVSSPGFLQRRVSNINYLSCSSSEVSRMKPLVVGDFNGDNAITVSDIVTSIRAFNNLSDPAADLANHVFGHKLAIGDLVTIIRNFNTNPLGE